MENCAAHNIILAKCGLEVCVELINFSFAAAFHIVFLCNLVNLKKHRLRLGILELKFFEFPALRQYFFVSCHISQPHPKNKNGQESNKNITENN